MRRLLLIALLLMPLAAHAQCPPSSYGVKEFGAKGDNLTDDTAAIYAALLSAETPGANQVTRPLCFPPGNFRTSFPIVISDPNNVFPRVQGSGGMTTTDPQTMIGPLGQKKFPAIVVIPNNYITGLGTIAVPPLVGVTGQGLQFDSSKAYGLNMSELGLRGVANANNPNPLNGLSDFSIQFYMKPAGSGRQEPIAASSNGVRTDGVMDITYTIGSTITADINIGGVVKTVPAAGTVTAGTTYWVDLELDSANSKIWLYLCTPGQVGCAPLSSVAATGTATEPVAETLLLGGLPNNGWPFEGIEDPFDGVIQSLDIEKAALHQGATITAPNTASLCATSSVADTLYCSNFTSIAPTKYGATNTPFVSVDYVNGALQDNAWQTIWNSFYPGNARAPQISDLATNGGTMGLFIAEVPLMTLANLTLGGCTYGCWEAYNNIFSGRAYNITLDPVQYAAFGLAESWAFGPIYDVAATGSYYPLASGNFGFGTLYHPIETASSTTISGIRTQTGASGFSESTIIDNESDIENGGNANGIEIYGGGANIDLVGGAYAQAGTGVPILVDVCGITKLNVFGGFLAPLTNPAVDFVKSPPCAAGTDPFVGLHGTNVYVGGGAAITNQPQWVTVVGGLTDIFVTLNGTSAGSAVYSEPEMASHHKTFQVYLNGYENTTAVPQTITMRMPFTTVISSASAVSGNCAGVTANTTTVTLPSSMGATQTGLCNFTGY